MTDKTLWVRPEGLRDQAKVVRRVAEDLGTDVRAVRDDLTPTKGTAAHLEAAGATETLRKLWETYLSGWGRTLDGYADRLDNVATAYEKRDAEAAEALGIALPPDEPYRRRPGRSEF
ncbi:MAG: type VII secretion target [Micromonosporaceae bacterium]